MKLATLALLAIATSAIAAPATTTPNILLIMADDVGTDALGCYGGESYATPNLDKLATEGMRFTHGYAMPVCHPTRVCILTGRYPVHLGSPRWGSFPKSEESATFASILKRNGYATAVAGKWQLSLLKKDLTQPHRMGFDEYCLFGWHEGARFHDPYIYQNTKLRTDTDDKYGPDLYVDFLVDFMERNKDRPFLAYYPMALAHDVTDDLKDRQVPYVPGKDRWMNFKEMIESMDDCVGRLVAALDRLKLRENTLIIFNTDNGSAGRSKLRHTPKGYVFEKVVSTRSGVRVPGGKGLLNDRGTRVPYIANWPGKIRPGQVVDDLIDLSDILPTMTALANAPTPNNLDGQSFAWRLTGNEGEPRKWVFAEHRGKMWVRTKRFKLYNDGRFYNVADDPEERVRVKSPLGEAKVAHRFLSQVSKQVFQAKN